jgi:hypothetical protein
MLPDLFGLFVTTRLGEGTRVTREFDSDSEGDSLCMKGVFRYGVL